MRLILINLPGGMRAMTMHDGEGHALTDTTAEVRDLAKYAHELRHTDAVFQRTRAAAVAPT
jgi:hypothetical protein